MNMSFNRKKCTVLGCESENVKLRSFPRGKINKERFLKWLRACGNVKLLKLSERQLQLGGICDRHFEAKVIMVTTLSKVAVPILYLPKPIDSSYYKFNDIRIMDTQTIDAQKIDMQMNDGTLVSLVSEKGKAVIVLSTAHHDVNFNPRIKKLMSIEHYNAAKDAMDAMERTYAIYSVSKKTKRWPLAMFFELLDVASVNAQILYTCRSKFVQKYRKGFLKTLALTLLKPHLQTSIKTKSKDKTFVY
ncbi:uncharacterized protein [Anoplolepis gracilipes]|uniref:uncharacterized protein isoform X1 n=1 Tax=Anoplolepis gracilipes TaxID=354296 RepID=UPI003BA1CB06